MHSATGRVPWRRHRDRRRRPRRTRPFAQKQSHLSSHRRARYWYNAATTREPTPGRAAAANGHREPRELRGPRMPAPTRRQGSRPRDPRDPVFARSTTRPGGARFVSHREVLALLQSAQGRARDVRDQICIRTPRRVSGRPSCAGLSVTASRLAAVSSWPRGWLLCSPSRRTSTTPAWFCDSSRASASSGSGRLSQSLAKHTLCVAR